MRSLGLTVVVWRKSSYSNQDGGACVEISEAPIGLSASTWRKSSHSNSDGGACVEVADSFVAVVPVRDSKNPRGPVLAFPVGGWSSFVAAVKDGALGV
ncbi:DUF397 domain-containing protein [Streptomyces sp. NBC_01317]|uniref:DUF397 domain-containing protein n=1 Tax=Streptomyces sp. NBC_01317 TaxID=2903822 RepID=UPI002E13777E|nr:DUF397 domain-containing protein [Streptomyces sp. NBC_01317]